MDLIGALDKHLVSRKDAGYFYVDRPMKIRCLNDVYQLYSRTKCRDIVDGRNLPIGCIFTLSAMVLKELLVDVKWEYQPVVRELKWLLSNIASRIDIRGNKGIHLSLSKGLGLWLKYVGGVDDNDTSALSSSSCTITPVISTQIVNNHKVYYFYYAVEYDWNGPRTFFLDIDLDSVIDASLQLLKVMILTVGRQSAQYKVGFVPPNVKTTVFNSLLDRVETLDESNDIKILCCTTMSSSKKVSWNEWGCSYGYLLGNKNSAFQKFKEVYDDYNVVAPKQPILDDLFNSLKRVRRIEFRFADMFSDPLRRRGSVELIRNGNGGTYDGQS